MRIPWSAVAMIAIESIVVGSVLLRTMMKGSAVIMMANGKGVIQGGFSELIRLQILQMERVKTEMIRLQMKMRNARDAGQT